MQPVTKPLSVLVAISLTFQATTAVQAQITTAWADMLVSQGLLIGFECPSLIDEYATEHPDATIVKSGVESTMSLTFMGMQDMFTVGGIYSVQDMYTNPLYQELATSFDEQFKSEMEAQPAMNKADLADRIIEMCRQFVF